MPYKAVFNAAYAETEHFLEGNTIPYIIYGLYLYFLYFWPFQRLWSAFTALGIPMVKPWCAAPSGEPVEPELLL